MRAFLFIGSVLVLLGFLSACAPVGTGFYYGAAAQTTGQASTTGVVQSVIVNDFNGFNHGNLYQLRNGQIWEQTEFYIWYYYWYQPTVTIYPENGAHRMKVDGIAHAVTVKRLR